MGFSGHWSTPIASCFILFYITSDGRVPSFLCFFFLSFFFPPVFFSFLPHTFFFPFIFFPLSLFYQGHGERLQVLAKRSEGMATSLTHEQERTRHVENR